ncbi:MAG: hypothetical protein ABIP35_02195 [Ginsengibacter sp.]
MQMTIPGGLIAIVISLFIFYYYNKTVRAKREERRDRLKEKRQDYLDAILKSKEINKVEE